MNKFITLHNWTTKNPIIVFVDEISAIEKCIDRIDNSKCEYTCIYLSSAFTLSVEEHIDEVMRKIKNFGR